MSHRRLYVGLSVLALLLLIFFAAPVYPQSLQAGIFIGRSPNCAAADPTCGVTTTGMLMTGYSSPSYALLGIGYPTTYHSTTTLVLPTTTLLQPGYTAYTITVNGAPDLLNTIANSTAGPVRYGCVSLIPAGVTMEVPGPELETFTLANGTTVQVSEC